MSTVSDTEGGVSPWRVPAVQFLGSLFFTGFWFAWTFLYAIAFGPGSLSFDREAA